MSDEEKRDQLLRFIGRGVGVAPMAGCWVFWLAMAGNHPETLEVCVAFALLSSLAWLVIAQLILAAVEMMTEA